MVFIQEKIRSEIENKHPAIRKNKSPSQLNSILSFAPSVRIKNAPSKIKITDKTCNLDIFSLSQIKEINSVKNGRNPLKKTALCAAGANIKPLKTNSI